MKNKFWPPNSSEWTEVAPEEQGLDSGKIADMFEFIEKNSYDVHSVIIVRNGFLVTEKYLSNSQLLDTKSYPGGIKIHNQWSATKSVISILIGIALQEGFIDNISQTLYEFFRDIWNSNFTDSEIKKNVTIEQLLKMNAGFMGGKEAPKTKDSFDLIKWALEEVPIGFTPGQAGKFEYSNDGVNLLSGIITKVTKGKSAEEFAKEYLFTPLGISEDEYDWWHDDEGISAGGYGLSCTPKVQAKIGILCLNNGNWNGTQLVEPNFMSDAISPQTGFYSKGKDKQSGVSYGYLWVITEKPFKGYYAAGAAGQCIFVIPEYNVTVGVTGALEAEWFYEQMISDYILPK